MVKPRVKGSSQSMLVSVDRRELSDEEGRKVRVE
jgi:hypothetical protein